MKKFFIVLLVFASIAIFSCKKSSTNANTAEVKYSFTSNISDQYRLEYADNNGALVSETFTGTSWTKTINMNVHADVFNPNIARLTVYPPTTWISTSPPATVGLKIFVNNTLESSVDSVLKASDKTGVFAIASF